MLSHTALRGATAFEQRTQQALQPNQSKRVVSASGWTQDELTHNKHTCRGFSMIDLSQLT